MEFPRAFYKRIKGYKFNLFLLARLPLAYLAGVKLTHLDPQYCSTKIRFRWINQNPFRSLYFAALHMAAELSTGLQLFQYQSKEFPFSMLLTQTEAEFVKKAIGTISFLSSEGEAVSQVLDQLIDHEQDQIKMKVEAFDESNELVARFYYTWSLKSKA